MELRDGLRIAMSSIMRGRSGVICSVNGRSPVSGLHERAILTASAPTGRRTPRNSQAAIPSRNQVALNPLRGSGTIAVVSHEYEKAPLAKPGGLSRVRRDPTVAGAEVACSYSHSF